MRWAGRLVDSCREGRSDIALRAILGALLLAVVFQVGGGLVDSPVVDDAYIYPSAARTLRDTGRLAASPFHDTLVGITCPLYPTLLAGLGLVADLPRTAVAIGVCAALLGTWFAFSLALEAQRPLRSGVVALVASLPVALSGIVATNSISGMESILTFLGIVLLAWVHARHGTGWRSGLVASALAALRFDGILVTIAVVVEALATAIRAGGAGRTRRIRAVLEFLVPVVIAVSCLAGIFLLSTGQALPNTVSARVALYGWGEKGVFDRIVSAAFQSAKLVRSNPWWSALGLLGAAGSWAGSRAESPVASTGRWLSLLPIGYVAVLGLEGVPLDYQSYRYLLPGITAGLLLCVIGLARSCAGWSRPAAAVVVGMMTLGILQEAPTVEQNRAGVGLLRAGNARYDEILHEMGRLAAPCDRIAVVDTGRPLWILRQRVFDAGGLVDQAATATFIDGATGSPIPFDRRDLAPLLAREDVDWFVVLDGLWAGALPFRPSESLQRVPLGAPWSVYRKPVADGSEPRCSTRDPRIADTDRPSANVPSDEEQRQRPPRSALRMVTRNAPTSATSDEERARRRSGRGTRNRRCPFSAAGPARGGSHRRPRRNRPRHRGRSGRERPPRASTAA